jgi:hypothetical protein
MINLHKLLLYLMLATFIFFLYPAGSYAAAETETTLAYLDPGTGTFIIMIVMATFFGAIYWIRAVFSKIGSAFTGLFSREKD